MARRFTRRAGGLPAPQRQIANAVPSSSFGQITFGATSRGSVQGSIGSVLIESAATLVRTRGTFSAMVNVSGTSNAIISVVFGLIVVSLEAFNAGLASIPTPLADGGRPWIVWQPLHLVATGTTPDQGAFGKSAIISFDSRGMRKMKTNEVLTVVFEADQLSGTTGTVVNCAVVYRNQFKL